MTVTKKDIVNEMTNRTGLSEQTVKEAVETILDSLCRGLAQDGNVEIRNFGIFKKKHLPRRRGRNPRTNEAIVTDEKNLVNFKPGKKMSEAIQQ